MKTFLKLFFQNYKEGLTFLKYVLFYKFINRLYCIGGKCEAFADGVINKNREFYTEVLFYFLYRKHINWDNPVWFDEKLSVLKCRNYCNNFDVIRCADKFRVRDYVKEKGLERILTKVYTDAEMVEKLNLSDLPERFVVKRNNDAGGVIIFCGDKDVEKIRDKIIQFGKETVCNYGLFFAEYHYQFIKPHYFVEEYLGTRDGRFPYDYKFYCMNGKPRACLVCVGRENEDELIRFLVDADYNYLDYMPDELHIVNEERLRYKPKAWEELKRVAEILAGSFLFVRVDLYDCDGRVVFGEMTFTPLGGRNIYFNEEGQIYLGSMLNI